MPYVEKWVVPHDRETLLWQVQQVFPDPKPLPTGIWSNTELAEVFGAKVLNELVSAFKYEAEGNPMMLRMVLSQGAAKAMISQKESERDVPSPHMETKKNFGAEERARMFHEMSEAECRHYEGLSEAFELWMNLDGELQQIADARDLQRLRLELIPKAA